MRLYRALIRPKIDYGCQVYGAASPTNLKALDAIANEAMRISLGAFKSTPAMNLIVANEPELQLKRKEMMLKYYFKLRWHILNPAYNYCKPENRNVFLQQRIHRKANYLQDEESYRRV